MNKKGLCIILGILILISLNFSTGAVLDGTRESRYRDDIQVADLIIFGNISHIKSIYSGENDHGNIITTADLEVHDIIKQGNTSNFKIGDIIPIYVEGGTVGNHSASADDGVRLWVSSSSNNSFESLSFLGLNERYKKGMYYLNKMYDPDPKKKELIIEILQGNLTSDQQIDLINKSIWK